LKRISKHSLRTSHWFKRFLFLKVKKGERMFRGKPFYKRLIFSGGLLLIVVLFGAALQAKASHSQDLIEEGRQIFRFDTFGDEDFWGGQLRLHEAIEGEKFGGVGPGVSPATAPSVSLKVDVDALPRFTRNQLRMEGRSERPGGYAGFAQVECSR
jgi:hypothetical protein